MRYDFALLFTALTALTGLIWLIDALLFAPARRKTIAEEQGALDAIVDACIGRVRALAARNRIQDVAVDRANEVIGIRAARAGDSEKFRALLVRDMPELDVKPTGEGLEATFREPLPKTSEPVVVEYARSLFPVILIILLVRSFLGEPYRIPSESMMPNLLIGDFILVNKYAYGLRLPVLDTKIVKVGEPQRGDVIVFHPPMASNQNEVWIKRVIGLPGDVIDYHDYQLKVNGKPVPHEEIGDGPVIHLNNVSTPTKLVREDLPGRTHTILQTDSPREESFGTWTVPSGHYFMMGDDRDDSEDGRFWQDDHFAPLYLPERNIVGKAVLVWMNFDWNAGKVDSSRIGTIIH